MAQTQNPAIASKENSIAVESDEISTLQQSLDEQAARGFRVSQIAYHSSIKNLHAKGRLEIKFETVASPNKYKYRAFTAEMTASALEKEINAAGSEGFRLLKQTPIPFESGLIRPRDMLLAVMEKTDDASARYDYRLIAYRHYETVKRRVRQALGEGFVKVCDMRFGAVSYLTLEREIK